MSFLKRKYRKKLSALNRLALQISRENLSDLCSTHFNWKRIDKLTSAALIKLMASYMAITATATQSIGFFDRWELTKIGLPFNWQLLFWGSLSYSIGYLIYLIKCPSFIKQYPNFQSVRSSSMIIDDYIDELEFMKSKGISLGSFKNRHQEIIDCLNKKTPFKNENNDCLLAIQEYAIATKGANRGNIEKSKELYNIIINALSPSNNRLSFIALLLIYFSFSVLFLVALSNIFTAICYLVAS